MLRNNDTDAPPTTGEAMSRPEAEKLAKAPKGIDTMCDCDETVGFNRAKGTAICRKCGHEWVVADVTPGGMAILRAELPELDRLRAELATAASDRDELDIERQRVVGLLETAERELAASQERVRALERIQEDLYEHIGEKGIERAKLVSDLADARKVIARIGPMCADWEGAAAVHYKTADEDHGQRNRGAWLAKAATYQRCAELLRALLAPPTPEGCDAAE